ncbi:MAG TPA: ATP-binding protein, partial [Gemmatimonadales bacterium]|nr:ATP-binding protein [Gemmatimonadales bacterium]
LTREQIRRLVPATPGQAPPAPKPSATAAAGPVPVTDPAAGPPAVPAGVPQFHLAASVAGVTWQPAVLGVADLSYSNARLGIDHSQRVLHVAPFLDGPVAVDWGEADRLEVGPEAVAEGAPSSGAFGRVPAAALSAKGFGEWEKGFGRWLRANEVLVLQRSAALGLVSRPGETEGDFRARLLQAARERRDERVAALRGRYEPKVAALQEKLRVARDRVAREQGEATAQKVQTAATMGSAILGALFGRKAISAANASRVGTTIRGMGRSQKAAGDVARAQATLAELEQKLATIEREVQDEVSRLESGADLEREALETVTVKPKFGTVHIHAVGLVWLPWTVTPEGRSPAW